MRKSFYLATTLLAVVFSISQIFAGYSWEETKISRVLSANAFITGQEQFFRIIGIEPIDTFSTEKREACHAKESFREIKNLLLSNEILTAIDEKVPEALHLKIDKEYVTEIILRNGWAKMNDDEVSSYFSARFKKAQTFAQENKLGLWATCIDDLNWQKIRGKFGGRMREFKKRNTVFLGDVAMGEVEEVLSGNEFKLKNGPIIKLLQVEIPRENNQAAACFRENSRNYLENLILGKKVRLEKELNSREITDYKLERKVFLLNPLTSRLAGGKDRVFVNEKMIADGFGKYSQSLSSNYPEFELLQKPHPSPLLEGEGAFAKIQTEVYANPRGAWEICARDILNTDFSATKKEETREIDEDCPIKGNISGTKKLPIKTYHTILSGWYDRIQAEQCFKTEEEANLAGFRKIK